MFFLNEGMKLAGRRRGGDFVYLSQRGKSSKRHYYCLFSSACAVFYHFPSNYSELFVFPSPSPRNLFFSSSFAWAASQETHFTLQRVRKLLGFLLPSNSHYVEKTSWKFIHRDTETVWSHFCSELSLPNPCPSPPQIQFLISYALVAHH